VSASTDSYGTDRHVLLAAEVGNTLMVNVVVLMVIFGLEPPANTPIAINVQVLIIRPGTELTVFVSLDSVLLDISVFAMVWILEAAAIDATTNLIQFTKTDTVGAKQDSTKSTDNVLKHFHHYLLLS
jgi:hypothetical protein